MFKMLKANIRTIVKLLNPFLEVLEIIKLALRHHDLKLFLIFIIGLVLEIYATIRSKRSLKSIMVYITEFRTIFEEIFEESIYDLSIKYVQNFKEGVIIDCGAHIGLFTVWVFQNLKDVIKQNKMKIIAIEPVSRNYRLLLFNIKLHNLESTVIPLKIGLSDKFGFHDILIPETWGASSSSMLATHISKLRTTIKHSETVPTVTLDKLIKMLKLERVELIKMDIEGMEKRVLESSQNVLAITNGIVVEVHTTVNEPDDIITLLEKHGFVIDYIKKKSNIDTIIFSHKPIKKAL
jgi:FkbM family methyltransferase